jgi:hypothetical protein
MARTLRKLAVGVATVTIVTMCPVAASEAHVTISVRVDNLIGVPTDWLQEAENEASEAYETIGVSLVWLNDAPAKLDGVSGDHRFNVVLGRSIRMKRAPQEALGFAPHHTNRVYIFGIALPL